MHKFACEIEQHAFRSHVMAAATSTSAPANARESWLDVTGGRSSIVDAFTTPSCSYLVTTRAWPHAPLPPRSVLILEKVLTGSYPKALASDLQLSASTIATTLKEALDRVGAACLPSKVPLGLLALACAATGAGPQLQCSPAELLGIECEIITAPLPSLTHLLSPTVEQVFHMHVAGRTHREIAALRGTSCRTIANQLAVAFRRLGRSGRLNVLEVLMSGCHEQRGLVTSA